MPSLLPGVRCGAYTLGRLVGAGEAAEVYEAFTSQRERLALKIIREQVPLESAFQARVAHEAESLAMVEHVNVVRFHDAGVHEGRFWLARELIDGPDLTRVAAEGHGRLPVARAVSYMRQACEGVLAAHRKGIVHRALSPENLYVAHGDLLKVNGFGSVKLAWGIKTAGAERVGAVRYMAPEQIRDGKPAPINDVYSLGSLLYEIIAGEHPIVHRQATFAAVCELQIRVEPPPLANVARDVPSDLSLLVQRAMQKDPARRCSMKELADELAEVLDRLNASRRAVARALGLPNRAAAVADTELSMPAWSDAAPAVTVRVADSGLDGAASGSAPGASSTARESARGGTLPMPVYDAGATEAEGSGARSSEAVASVIATLPGPEPIKSYSWPDADREALPPPAPPSLPPLPATLRAPSPPPPAPALPASSLRPPTPVAISMPPANERRSTSVPVESVATPAPPRDRPRAARGVAVGVGAAALMAVAAWWTVFGREAVRPSASAQPVGSAPVVSAPVVSAPVVVKPAAVPAVKPAAPAASTTASAVASASAAPRRSPPPAPVSPRRKLPF